MPSFAPSLTMTSLPGTVPATKPLIAADNRDWQFSFHNLIGIINPLQHLPVVGTLYRAITGDKIGTPEKIAGDALYGGLWGAVSSVADTAFEAATGKDFGSTLLSMVMGDKADTAVASNAAPSGGKNFFDRASAFLTGREDGATAVAAINAPTAPSVAALDIAMPALPDASIPAPAIATATPSTLDVVALTSALAQKGIDSDTAQRALMAYRRSQAPQSASSGALLAVAQ
jgi:hypothetical protein